MTRHMLNHINYTSDQPIDYRPSRDPPQERPMGMPLARQNLRADPMTRQSSRAGSTSQVHTTTNNVSGSPRRRIPVACGRCRKRKIRCSGDPGDNSGCVNCKGAGVLPGQCVFLRVQCEMRELVPDHLLMTGGYEQASPGNVDLHPYSSSSSASSSSSSLALGLPHPNMSATNLHPLVPQHLMAQHSLRQHGMNPSGMHNNVMSVKATPTYHHHHHHHHQDPMGSNGGTDGSGLLLPTSMGLSSHRNSYDGDMSNGTGNSTGISGGDIYNGSFPQYLQPEIATASSLMSGQPGQWSPLAPSGRQQNAGLYLDQDQASGLQPYIPASNARLPSDGSLGYLFPALNSLSSSLPEGISSRVATLSDKVTLPPPFRTQSSESGSVGNTRSNGVANGSDMPTGSYAIQPAQRGFPPWNSDSCYSSPPSSSPMTIPTTKTSPISGISPPLAYLGTPASHQSIIPASLPLPPTHPTYGTSQTFPLSSANSSLLPSGSHGSNSILNGPFDSFTAQAMQTHGQLQKPHCSGSEPSRNGSVGGGGVSKVVTPSPAPSLRPAATLTSTSTPAPTPAPITASTSTSSTSGPSNTPAYSRSSVGFYRTEPAAIPAPLSLRHW